MNIYEKYFYYYKIRNEIILNFSVLPNIKPSDGRIEKRTSKTQHRKSIIPPSTATARISTSKAKRITLLWNFGLN